MENCGKLYGLLTVEERKWLLYWLRRGGNAHGRWRGAYPGLSLGTLPFVPVATVHRLTITRWKAPVNIQKVDSIKEKLESLE